MPPLSPNRRHGFIRLPPTGAIDGGETDVLIVGGGPAGLGAALGAAWTGARAVLTEQYGFLGGNATAALVAPFASWHTEGPEEENEGNPVLAPTDHGEGKPTIGGVLSLFIERLVRAGGAIPPTSNTGYVVPFDAEIFKALAFDLLDEAGVRFLLHAFSCQVIHGKTTTVLFATKSGLIAIRSKVVVDCTGDGDVAAQADAPYKMGREEDGLTQPMTLMFKMAQYHHEAFAAYVREHPREWRGVHGLWSLISRATERGELDLPREDLLFFADYRPTELVVNSTRVVKVLGTDVWDLTYAEWQARRQMRQIAAFLKKYVPGFRDAYIGESGATIGVRESRRILGAYVLTGDDILGARKFDDCVARGTYPIDIHSPTGTGTLLRRVPPGQAYDIPLRCLIPEKTETILTAGRCISGTHEALSSYRVMPISMATGQAAGVCAALAAQNGVPPRQISHTHVQKVLRSQKAILSDSD